MRISDWTDGLEKTFRRLWSRFNLIDEAESVLSLFGVSLDLDNQR